jgi:hypothetical protein
MAAGDAPSSSGRTADFGSVNRGSNPRGAASRRVRGDVPEWFRERSAKPRTRVRFPSSPPYSEHESGPSAAGFVVSGNNEDAHWRTEAQRPPGVSRTAAVRSAPGMEERTRWHPARTDADARAAKAPSTSHIPAENRWRAALTWTDDAGKRHRRVVSGKTQAEVRRRLGELLTNLERLPAGTPPRPLRRRWEQLAWA